MSGRSLVAVLLLLLAVVVVPASARADVETFTTTTRLSTAGMQPNGPIEVVDVLDGGKRAIATGGAGIQFVDLTDPDKPVLDRDTLPTSGTYTASVANVPGSGYALAAVQRADSTPTDWLLVVDPTEKSIVRRIDIPKGPDSIGVAPDGQWGAIAIEDEFDPKGSVVAIDLRDADPAKWKTAEVAIPLADADLEPEYVDVNARHQAVVSLQENNAYAIVDLPSKSVVNLFSAGHRTSGKVDLTEDESLEFSTTPNLQRQPDAVEWMADGRHFISADEGEDEGGRSWSIWSSDGELISSVDSYELDNAVRGYYPDDRSEHMGIEPEGAEVATIEGREYALIAGERNNSVTVYDITDPRAPKVVSLARTGGRPEVVVRIPGTTRFITGDEDSGLSIIAGVDRDELDADRPKIVSDAPWANLSGFGAASGGRVLMTTRYGPNDIHELRPAGAPRGELPGRRIVRTGLEGRLTDVAPDPLRGGYWVTTNQQALVRLNADGTIAKAFPTLAGSFSSGAGVAVAPDGSAVYVATAGRTVLKVDPLTGQVLERVSFDGPSWIASSSDRNRMNASDLDIAPGGRLAILLSATDRVALQAGVMALPLAAIDAAAEGANVTSQLREIVRIPIPLESPRGVAALAVSADGTVWTGNDADKGGESDVRRFPRVAATPVVPEPDGAALPSGTPVLEAPLERARDQFELTGLLLPDATSYLVGGVLGAVGSGPRTAFARLRPETATLASTGPVYTRAAGAFELDAAAGDAAGGLFVGGLFDAVDGAAHANLVRLTAAGAVDPAFTVQVNGRVRALARAGGALYIAGNFTQVGGEPHQGIAKIDIATGAVDPAFTGALVIPAAATDLSLAAGEGRVYIVGQLTSVGGQARSGRMAAVDAATGAVLPFAPTGAGNESVAAVVDGDLLIGGLFTGIRRYEADGTLSAGWTPPAVTSNTIYDLEVTADGVYVAGDFPTFQDSTGNAVRGIVARLDRTTGRGDLEFAQTASIMLGTARRLVIADGLLYAAGENLMRQEHGTSEYGRPSGGLVVLDALSGRNVDAPGSLSGTVRDLQAWGSGLALLGGADTRLADTTPAEVTAIDTLSGRVDRTFRPRLYGTGTALKSRLVGAGERHLYLAANNGATYERPQLAPTITKLERTGGTVDPGFEPYVTGTVADGQLAGGKLYVGGTITSVDGRLRKGLAAIDPDTGRVDLAFNPKLTGTVNALAVADGVVYAAGDFRDESTALAAGVKAFDARTGAELPAKVPALNAGVVSGLAFDPRTKVLSVIGDISQADGTAVTRLVMYDTVAGKVLPAPRLTGFTNVSATPQALFVFGGGNARIAGEPSAQNRGVIALDPRTGAHLPHFRPAVTEVQEVSARGSRVTMLAKIPADTQILRYFVFEPAAPTSVVAPAIVGTPKEGVALTCDPGRWDGAPETFSFQWRRAGEPIEGATAASYTPVEGDVGAALTCAVTGTNAKGSATATSAAATPTVGGPRNLTRPAVTLAAGQLSASSGEWDRSPTMFAYQWLRDGVAIDGATAPSYAVQPADEGRGLTVRVTATNANGSGLATSESLRVPAPPVNTGAPAISGTSTLTATPGEWRNGPAFAYAWLRDGAPIDGASEPTYVLTAADRGRQLSVRVTATTADGTATATSAERRIPAPPLVTIAPSISGTPASGNTLTAGTGEWEPAGATFAYQWLRDGEPIAAADGPSYLVALGDAGARIAVRVRATNGDGTAEATSAPVEIAIVPSNIGRPTIAGKPAVGYTLEAGPGEWTGGPDRFAYQWLRDGSAIDAATSKTYTATEADEGRTLAVRVIATTAAGASEPATSAGVELPEFTPADVVFRTGPPITEGLPGEVVHLSDDGNRMLRTNLDEGVALLDSSNPRDIRELVRYPLSGTPYAQTNSATFTRDGRFILAATEDGTGGDRPGRVTVLERGPGEELREVRRLALPRQPDAIEVSPDGRYAAIAIEAERRDAGQVVILHLSDPADPATWTTHLVPVELGPEYPGNADPQPEYVDINQFNEVAVSIQEQNAIGIIDAEAAADGDPATPAIVRIISAGTTDFNDDTNSDGRFDWNPSPATFNRVARQPDAVGWTADGQSIVAVGEGETTDPHEWMIYSRFGELLYASGAAMHRNAALFGQHPVNFRGSQPEGAYVETYRGHEYVFIVTERTANLSVYDITTSHAAPKFVGTFPTGIRPETVVFNQAKGFAVTGNETDTREPGSTLLALKPEQTDRDQPLLRGDEPWTNLRGLGAESGTKLLAISSELPHKLRRIDLSARGEAKLTTLATLPGAAATSAVEAVTPDGEGGAWIASPAIELMNVAADGTLKRTIDLPDDLDPVGVTFTPDRSALLVIETGGEAGRVRLSDGAVTRFTVTTTVQGQFTDLATAPDGRVVAMRANSYNVNDGPGATALVTFPADATQDVAATTLKTITASDQSPYASDRLTALAIAPDGDVWWAHGANLSSANGTDAGLRRTEGLFAPAKPVARDAGLPSERNTFPWAGVQARLAGGDLLAQGSPRAIIAPTKQPHGPYLAVVDPKTGLPRAGEPLAPTPLGPVESASPDGSGGYYAAGYFGEIAGAFRYLVHIRADGTIDRGFLPEVSGTILGLHHTGGRIWISGYFDRVNGVPRQRIAALRPDGSLDESITIGASTEPYRFIGIGGKIYYSPFGGSVTIGGVQRGRIARIDTATGTVDAFDPAPNSDVETIVADGERVILGGYFDRAGGGEAERIAIVDGTTGALIRGLSANAPVHTLAVAGRKLWAGGQFSSLGGKPAFGAGWVDLDAPENTGGLSEADGPDGMVSLVHPLPDGDVLISGGFFRVFGQERSGLAIFDGATLERRTGVRGEIRPAGSSVGASQGYTLANDRVLLTGQFLLLGTPGPASALSRVDRATGAFDPTFRPPADFDPEKLAADDDYIYGLQREQLRRVDRYSGELDADFTVALNEAWGDSAELIVDGDRVLVVSHALRLVNGVTRAGIAAIDRESGELLPFNPRASGTVHGAVVTPDGRMFVAGAFSRIAGADAGGVAELDPESGALLGTFEGISLSRPAQYEERAITYDPTRKRLYIGNVRSVNDAPAGGLVAFDVAGARAAHIPSFDPVYENPDDIDDLGVVDGHLVVNGRNSPVNGDAAPMLYSLTPDGDIDPRFAPDRPLVSLGFESFGSTIAWQGELFEPAAPSSNVAPSITGTPRESAQLTCAPGDWDAAPDAFAYRWLRDGVPIAGASSATYTPVAADVGTALRCGVTATNASGEGHAESAPVTVLAGAPASLTAPELTGVPVAGRVLTASTGTWRNDPATFAYQWLRDGEPIALATASTYLLTPADTGHGIAVRVVATNAIGDSAPANSAELRIAAVPVNTAPPAISGTAAVGAPLTASPGTWSGGPATFAYQWLRDGQPVASASAATYTPVDADEGRVLSVRVTASTAAGAGTPAVSAGVTVPLPPAPVNTARPVIRGSAIVGQTLTCEPGTFTGKNVVVFTRWVRGGDQVPGELAPTYVVTSEDVGRTLACRNVASNKGGTTIADSTEVRPERAPAEPEAGVQGAPAGESAGGGDGAPAAKNDRVAAGRDAKVACKVSGPRTRQKVTCKVTLATTRATLTRDGRVYARGTAKKLQATRRITRGTYTLKAGRSKLEVTVR